MDSAHDSPSGSPPPSLGRSRPRRSLSSLLEAWLGLSRLDAIRKRVLAGLPPGAGIDAFLDGCQRELGLRCELPRDELQRVPAAGGLLVVANHPHGIVDGLLLVTLLRAVRQDLRILGNRWLLRLPELRGLLLDVAVGGGRAAALTNTTSLRAACNWLAAGHAVLVFPAGQVAARTWRRADVHDAAWSPTVARLQQRTAAAVLPVHIGGRNSRLFQLAGLLHPRLRTLLLPRECLRQRGAAIAVRLGRAIQPRQLERFTDPRERIAYLRLRTEILARRPVVVPASRQLEPIVPPVEPAQLWRDVAAMHGSQLLARSGGLEVLCASAPQIPHVLREIGRLREQAFRSVGEGTGRAIDLDEFDAHYEHLFVWDSEQGAIVGAYRIGRVGQLLASRGRQGLYTSTLYDYDDRFLAHVGSGLELGRSFVVPERQREFLPLQLLWRGIGACVARQPQCHVLFGAVSISDRHDEVSKRLMLDHLRGCLDPGLAALVRPRHAVPGPPHRASPLCWTDAMVTDLGDVSAMVAEIERDGRGVPVLLREYLKLGGRLAGFDVDPLFGNSITALVVVDLLRTEPRLLGRHLGKETAAAFLAGAARERQRVRESA